jgi:hypothetical protein
VYTVGGKFYDNIDSVYLGNKEREPEVLLEVPSLTEVRDSLRVCKMKGKQKQYRGQGLLSPLI